MISERRVKLAIAGMYIQGVFTRKLTEVRETERYPCPIMRCE